MSRDTSKEHKILDAARQVFQQKGFSGARMQEIADIAGMNKALLHYYFRSKQKLFEAVFIEALSNFLPRINLILNSEEGIFEKIHAFTDHYMCMLSANPYLPPFIIHELNQDPDFLHRHFAALLDKPSPAKFFKQLREAVESGSIRPVAPQQLIMNMISLCVFPFVGRPMFKTFLSMDEAQYNELLERRKEDVATFIINSIRL